MIKPVQEVATMIEEQDPKGLSTLPGIGAATAERIIAKLRRKVPKFALLITEQFEGAGEIERDIAAEVLDILQSLGHSESDARKRIETALVSKKKHKDAESLINEIYAQTQR